MNIAWRFFKKPELFIQQATARDWTMLVHCCREQSLLGHAYLYIEPFQAQLPDAIVSHFASGKVYADKQRQTMLQEMLLLESVFAKASFPILLVKGAAYRLHQFPFAAGRVFGDLDLLVPRQYMNAAVAMLQAAGFMDATEHDYDRRYYLDWSHQHPPLRHFTRGSEIDLHHTIFFAKSAVQVDVERFISNSTPIEGSRFSLPQPADMFVHSCLHLLYQEEHHKIIKDIVDLRELYLSIINKYEIIKAASLTNKPEVVALGLHLLSDLFSEPLSADERSFMQTHASHWTRQIIRYMVCKLAGQQRHKFATIWWVIRGHLIKMPWYLLVYHSLAKLWFGRRKRQKLSQFQQEIDKITRPKDA